MAGDRVDFFISHAGQDRAWAEWVAWQLVDARYRVELDVWDWAAGQNFVTKMSEALDRADRMIALFSTAYFERSRYTLHEYTAAAAHVPGGAGSRLVPVRVEDVPPEKVPAVLQPLVCCDVFGLDEETARRALLEAVAGPARPDVPPVFPGRGAPGAVSGLGGSGPRLPGGVPQIWWKVPARNPVFTGRDGLLVKVREQMLGGDRVVVQVLRGRGGMGKTQLAVQYAHLFAGDYDIVWWVDAEQPELIGDQLGALAVELQSAKPKTEVSLAVRAALAELRARDRWLLVFDNAEGPQDLDGLLPAGPAGHVLITSRARGWDDIAAEVPVDVFVRAESVAVLQARVPDLTESDARRLADRLGDFPLAVRQAARYMIGTGTSPDEYLRLLDTSPAALLSDARPATYPRSLAGVVWLGVDRLTADEPAAAELVKLCAFLAPEPDPAPPPDWFAAAAGQLPEALRARAADPAAFRWLLELISSRGLARTDLHGMYLHRLTQDILRDQLGPQAAAVMRACAYAVLTANDPGDATDPATWPAWAEMLPHLLAADPVTATGHTAADHEARDLACWANTYLLKRGDARGGHDLAAQLSREWHDQLGADDYHSIWAASILALALRDMGRYADARRLDEDALTRNRKLHGDDDPGTLHSAGNLAADLRGLGELQAARKLDEGTLTRRRHCLGLDHPDTLGSANGLALDLRELGDVEGARELDEDTLARRRRVLGPDQPDTLTSASNLAAHLRALGEPQAARELDEDTLARRIRVLGEDHPHTLASASNLAEDLRALGEPQAARELDEDTLARRIRVLGEDHPDTQRSADQFAEDLRALGKA
jgi:tetratricopeptide (TPR) repeat protein